jgi:hypothetical protein
MPPVWRGVVVILGHLDGDAAERLAQMDGDVTVSVDNSR